MTPRFEVLLLPVLGFLLYSTFVQVPLLHVRDAFRDGRFVLAILLGDFILIPLLVVWLTLQLLPDRPALYLGALRRLWVPCTDRFITFTQLVRGSTARAIAVTPLSLLPQRVVRTSQRVSRPPSIATTHAGTCRNTFSSSLRFTWRRSTAFPDASTPCI